MVINGLDEVVTTRGRVVLSASGELRAVVHDGDDEPRAVVAGDGLASVIAEAVLSGATSALRPSRGRVALTRPASAATTMSAREPREQAISVDMTNWSAIVEDRFVVKLVAHWGSADRAARQLARLAESVTELTPAFLGSLDWEHPESGRSTIALVSALIPDASDGWSWAVDDVLDFLGGGAKPEWPSRLGELTAGLHAELLAFADESARPPEGSALRASAGVTLDDALRVTTGAAGARLRNREAALRRAIASIPDSSPGPVFDIHGDWHVGQVLRAPSGDGLRYWAIDFDGDPQLTPAERDQPDFAARDVAHMLCSVELVGAAVMRRLGVASMATLDWATGARAELLAGYRDRLTELGSIHAFDERQLDGLVVEQLLRELLYADRFLPRWQYAPDAVLTFRYQRDRRAASSTEEPWTPPDFTTT